MKFPPLLSVTALVKKKEKILFLDSSYHPGLGLPGGMVNPGENFETALKREIFEETGLTVTQAQYLTSVAQKSFKGIPATSAVFLVKVKGQPISSVEGKLVWLKPHLATKRLFYPDNRLALKAYLQLKTR